MLTCVCCESADCGNEEHTAYWHCGNDCQLRIPACCCRLHRSCATRELFKSLRRGPVTAVLVGLNSKGPGFHAQARRQTQNEILY